MNHDALLRAINASTGPDIDLDVKIWCTLNPKWQPAPPPKSNSGRGWVKLRSTEKLAPFGVWVSTYTADFEACQQLKRMHFPEWLLCVDETVCDGERWFMVDLIDTSRALQVKGKHRLLTHAFIAAMMLADKAAFDYVAECTRQRQCM